MQALYDKIDSLNQEAYFKIQTDISRADLLMKEARAHSEKVDYTKGIAWSLLVSGLLEIELGKYDQAWGKTYQAHNLFEELSTDRRGISASLNGMGLICLRQGKMKEAFTHLQKALDLAITCNYKDMEYRAVNLMGILQLKMENYHPALRFFNKALKLITNEKKSGILNNLGCCYRAMGRYDQAIYYLKKAQNQAEQDGTDEITIPILEEIGLTLGKMKDYDQGIEILRSALEKCTDFHKRYKLSINIHLGELFIKKEEYGEAEEYLNRAREFITVSNSINNRDLYLYLSGLSEIKGNHREALNLYKNYHRLSGKLKSSELDEKIWQLETESLRRMNSRIKTVSDMGRKLTALQNRQEVIDTLFNLIKAIFAMDFFLMGEIVEEKSALEVSLYDSNCGAMVKSVLSCAETDTPESWVAIHRSSLVMNDLKKDYKAIFHSLGKRIYPDGVSSVICLPYSSGTSNGIIGIYCLKPFAFNREDCEFLEMLASYASIAMDNSRQTEIIKDKNRELEKLNRFDSLTGIYNRKEILSRLNKSMNICQRNNTPIHVLMVDVDHFKKINDTMGHSAGDHCLKTAGDRFRQLLQRSSDLYGRYGGEEFIIVLLDISDEEALIMAEKIRRGFSDAPIEWNGGTIDITISIGLCSSLAPGVAKTGAIPLIECADRNMYESKGKGRNRVTASLIN